VLVKVLDPEEIVMVKDLLSDVVIEEVTKSPG
jgi:hypothetical protein